MIALFIGLGCFALHMAVTLLWLRLPGRVSSVGRHAISAFATHLFGVALAIWLVESFAYWPVAAVSGFLAAGWLFAFSAVYKSVSLRILTQLDRTTGHELPFKTITEEFVRPEFAARIMVLVKMGLAEETPNGYALTEKGRRMARRIALIQRAWGIERSGMYGSSASTNREDETECCNHTRDQDHPTSSLMTRDFSTPVRR
jgi:hypothetical protein